MAYMPQGQTGGAGITNEMMQNPEFQQILMNLMRKKKLQAPYMQGQGQPNAGGMYAAMGQKLPQLQKMQEQMKVEDADRKAKRMKLDYAVKQIEPIAQQQQGMQQRQAAIKSV